MEVIVRWFLFLAAIVMSTGNPTLATIDCSKPSIVLIPGAWIQDIHMQPLAAALGAKGYEVISRTLPSFNSNNPEADTVSTDAEYIRNSALLPEINAGKDVVIVVHSYAGFPGPAAASGLAKTERQAAGQSGGVIGLIFMAAFVPKQGVTLATLSGPLPWLVSFPDTHQSAVSDPNKIFMNDMPEEVASCWAELFGRESDSAFNTPNPEATWENRAYHKRRVYLRTLLDQALPPEAQTSFISASGVEWDVQDLNASHTAFISEPGIVATAVDHATIAFQAQGVQAGQALAPVEPASPNTWASVPWEDTSKRLAKN
ncbi:uncharacterized protein KY384_007807 [Bacidia gigantensis]|uniref:uncharacterized protein n=1 Tax=Bacidia gigantensis TaxID=2732470 RepID=UPI001D05BA6F|nr:uncharacterized protein KY384_007807 [Bacidia gigantensis]KAG8527654.1 hypothetical protein KY384_007807 [Bacidia gigantensis]